MFVFPVGPLFRLRVSHHLDHAPFPHPAHQTGRAVFPHPAFGQGCTSYAASHVRPRTIAATVVGVGIIPAPGTDIGHGTVSFHFPAPSTSRTTIDAPDGGHGCRRSGRLCSPFRCENSWTSPNAIKNVPFVRCRTTNVGYGCVGSLP